MKNIHILPTDKPSRLGYIFESENYHIFTNGENPNDIADNLANYRNIYITSDEEIKEDYVIAYGVVIKVMMFEEETLYFVNGTKTKREDCKKIILTTDQDLIKDGVQAIDDEFLEWFVKNPSCESVEVEMNQGRYFDYGGNIHITNAYKIIIPKEPKQETTLEEAAPMEELVIILHKIKKNLTNKTEILTIKLITDTIKTQFVDKELKWQQQTIEEVFEWLTTNNYLTDLKETLIENFKNK